jgi:heme-degrading monooxygenase HmoA
MKVRRGKEAEFLRVFKKQITPHAQKQKGLRRLYLLRPTTHNEEFVALSLWNSERDAHEYVSSGTYDKNVDLLDGLLEGDPVLTTLTVALYVVGKSVQAKKKR